MIEDREVRFVTEEQIAAAIADVYAAEPSPEQLAAQLVAVAAAHNIDRNAILLWVHDRPRHEMSTAHFLRWCQRYDFASTILA